MKLPLFWGFTTAPSAHSQAAFPPFLVHRPSVPQAATAAASAAPPSAPPPASPTAPAPLPPLLVLALAGPQARPHRSCVVHAIRSRIVELGSCGPRKAHRSPPSKSVGAPVAAPSKAPSTAAAVAGGGAAAGVVAGPRSTAGWGAGPGAGRAREEVSSKGNKGNDRKRSDKCRH